MPNIAIQFEREQIGQCGNFSNNLFIKTNKSASLKVISKKANDLWYANAIGPQAKRDGISVAKYLEKYGTTVIFEAIKEIRLKTIA